ncbi:MAG: LptE family protein [Deltaproteobacteria bacterium]|nr:LptE family protein [Deltaproteobacteria bacterium]
MHKIISRFALVLVPVIAVSALSCGYRLGGGDVASPSGASGGLRRSVFVNVFDNDTIESGLSVMVSNAFSRRFSAGGRFIPDRTGADLTLTGRVVSLTDQSSARKAGGDSVERTLRMTVAVSLGDKAGKVVFSHPSLADFENYTVLSGDTLTTEQNRQNALLRLSERLAQKGAVLAEASLEGF